MSFISLAAQCLDQAAGTPVDVKTYSRLEDTEGMNLARLQRLGRCYREGWLSNVLRRITPLTARCQADYLTMADLFITTKADAETLLQRMSGDLSAFSTAAGSFASNGNVPAALQQHVQLYQSVAAKLERTFSITAPAPFASTTVDAALQAQIPFIRAFIADHLNQQNKAAQQAIALTA